MSKLRTFQEKIVEDIKNNLKSDRVTFDISMPGGTGFPYVVKLLAINHDVLIITHRELFPLYDIYGAVACSYFTINRHPNLLKAKDIIILDDIPVIESVKNKTIDLILNRNPTAKIMIRK